MGAGIQPVSERERKKGTERLQWVGVVKGQEGGLRGKNEGPEDL